jgi:spore germination protein YaaH
LREVWGFTAFWDERSTESASRNRDALDAVVTTWIALDTLTSEPVTLFMDSSRTTSPRRMALLTSWYSDRFHPASVLRLASDPEALARVASTTARVLQSGDHRGLVIDFEGHQDADLRAVLSVVRVIADTLEARRLGPLAVAIPAMDTGAYPARDFIDAGADFVLPMFYDQHWAGGEAGPVSDPAWVAAALDIRLAEVPASRIVAGLPLYGYRWPRSGAGVTVTYGEALAAAAAAGVALTRDSATGTLRGTAAGAGEIWVTDATLIQRLIDTVTAKGVERAALWYIGQEDQGIWPALRKVGAGSR